MEIQAILPFRTQMYALAIYIQGITRFTARDGFQGIPEAYHEAVKEFAATTYDIEYIDTALTNGYINQQEYDDTIAYIV